MRYCIVARLSLSFFAWGVRPLAFPELSTILPFHEWSGYEYLEVLFTVAPVLRVVGLALFGILHTHNLHYPVPTCENELVVEVHECKR